MNRKITRLLIANRGEIARRIALSARKLNISTLMLYSGTIPHFLSEVGDTFVRIPSDTPEYYLDRDFLVALAGEHDCDGVHPGYGFLSEDYDFAKKVEEAGLVWVGPTAQTIARMGNKINAKILADEARVPTIPSLNGFGINLVKPDFTPLMNFGEEVGYPLLLKAPLCGGGRGMVLIENEAAFTTNRFQVNQEIRNAAESESLILEKYIEKSRHIEVQILGDKAGKIITVGNRDCSIQRRYQKVIEEAPALGLNPPTIKALADAALALAYSVKYQSAGTVEFLLDASQIGQENDVTPFYFLEMNTRLQVEHTVTEEAYNIDLVEWQLRIASGESIPPEICDLKPSCFSIEARIYAEDYENAYQPSGGVVFYFKPFHGDNIRWEIGIDAIDEVTSHFDPMIAKVVAKGVNRVAAIKNLHLAIKSTILSGPKTNRELLLAITADELFTRKAVNTNYLKDHFTSLVDWITEQKSEYLDLSRNLLAKLTLGRSTITAVRSSLAEQTARVFSLKEFSTQATNFSLSYESEHHSPRNAYVSSKVVFGLVKEPALGMIPIAWVAGKTKKLRHFCVFIGGYSFCCLKEESNFQLQHNSQKEEKTITAPVPGRVIELAVMQGDPVEANQTLLKLESMKMEFEIKASRRGIVSEIKVKAGDQVNADDLLIILDKIAFSLV